MKAVLGGFTIENSAGKPRRNAVTALCIAKPFDAGQVGARERA
jgi:hypothetical protein